jgi:hypothetical protein
VRWRSRNGSTEAARVVLKPVAEHLNNNLPIAYSACDQRAGRRQPPILRRSGAIDASEAGVWSGQELLGCADSKIPIIDDLRGPAARPFAQVSLDVGLQSPGDAAKQNCLFDDFDSSPNSSRYRFLSAATFNAGSSSIAAMTVGSMVSGVLSISLNTMHALLGEGSKQQSSLQAVDFSAVQSVQVVGLINFPEIHSRRCSFRTFSPETYSLSWAQFTEPLAGLIPQVGRGSLYKQNAAGADLDRQGDVEPPEIRGRGLEKSQAAMVLAGSGIPHAAIAHRRENAALAAIELRVPSKQHGEILRNR